MIHRFAAFGSGLALAALLVVPSAAQTPARSSGWLGFAFEVEEGDAALRIEAVVPESPAQAAGLRAGDRVVRWNGRADPAVAVREGRLQPGDTVRLRVARSGQRDFDLPVVAIPRPLHVAGVGSVGEVVTVPRGRDVIVVPTGELARRMAETAGRSGEIAQRIRIHGDSLFVQADSIHSRLLVLLRDSLGTQLRELERALPDARIRIQRLDSVMDDARMGLALSLGRSGVAGAELADVTPGLGGYFGTDRGALVLRVAPETPAARAGLQEGDVVVRAGEDAIATVSDLRRSVAAARGAALQLEVVRRGERRTLTVAR